MANSITEPAVCSLEGLGTISCHVLVAGSKNVKGKLTFPDLITGAAANSQIVVTMNLNGGSAFYTGPAGIQSFESGTYANPGDTINVILTSSLPQDEMLNTVKTTISFY